MQKDESFFFELFLRIVLTLIDFISSLLKFTNDTIPAIMTAYSI